MRVCVCVRATFDVSTYLNSSMNNLYDCGSLLLLGNIF